MLADSIAQSKQSAIVSLSRTRAADVAKASAAPGGPVASITEAASDIGGANRAGFAHAGEQYRANTNWVYACTRLVSQRIAGQKIHVARDVGRGNRKGPSITKAVKDAMPDWLKADSDRLEPIDSHPLIDALDDPNAMGTRWGLVACLATSLELTGRQLLWCPAADGGRRNIMPIPTTWIEEVDSRRTTWKIRPAGSTSTFDIPGDEAVHLFYPDPADPFGAMSPLQRIAEAVVTDGQLSAAQRHAFRNGIFPRFALRVGKNPDLPGMPGKRPTFTPEQRKQLISAIKAVYGGVVNYDQPMILDGMIEEVFKLSSTVQEMDFLGSSAVTKSRILQGFGVSPILLGEVEGANRASATVADDILCSNKINPIIELLSQSLTKWLGPLFAGPTERLVVWIERAKARDPQTDLQKYKLLADKESITVNELRRAFNLPDIDGGDVLVAVRPSMPSIPAGSDGADGSKSAAASRMNGHANPADPLEMLLNPRLNPYTLQTLRS